MKIGPRNELERFFPALNRFSNLDGWPCLDLVGSVGVTREPCLVELSFKVHRRLTAERAVEPRAVVKDFDPLEDGSLGFGAPGRRRVDGSSRV